MDFHGMKYKALQSLCKKHKLPANGTTTEIINRLTSHLKKPEEEDVVVEERKSKKVRFNLDSEISKINKVPVRSTRSRKASEVDLVKSDTNRSSKRKRGVVDDEIESSSVVVVQSVEKLGQIKGSVSNESEEIGNSRVTRSLRNSSKLVSDEVDLNREENGGGSRVAKTRRGVNGKNNPENVGKVTVDVVATRETRSGKRGNLQEGDGKEQIENVLVPEVNVSRRSSRSRNALSVGRENEEVDVVEIEKGVSKKAKVVKEPENVQRRTRRTVVTEEVSDVRGDVEVLDKGISRTKTGRGLNDGQNNEAGNGDVAVSVTSTRETRSRKRGHTQEDTSVNPLIAGEGSRQASGREENVSRRPTRSTSRIVEKKESSLKEKVEKPEKKIQKDRKETKISKEPEKATRRSTRKGLAADAEKKEVTPVSNGDKEIGGRVTRSSRSQEVVSNELDMNRKKNDANYVKTQRVLKNNRNNEDDIASIAVSKITTRETQSRKRGNPQGDIHSNYHIEHASVPKLNVSKRSNRNASKIGKENESLSNGKVDEPEIETQVVSKKVKIVREPENAQRRSRRMVSTSEFSDGHVRADAAVVENVISSRRTRKGLKDIQNSEEVIGNLAVSNTITRETRSRKRGDAQEDKAIASQIVEQGTGHTSAPEENSARRQTRNTSRVDKKSESLSKTEVDQPGNDIQKFSKINRIANQQEKVSRRSSRTVSSNGASQLKTPKHSSSRQKTIASESEVAVSGEVVLPERVAGEVEVQEDLDDDTDLKSAEDNNRINLETNLNVAEDPKLNLVSVEDKPENVCLSDSLLPLLSTSSPEKKEVGSDQLQVTANDKADVGEALEICTESPSGSTGEACPENNLVGVDSENLFLGEQVNACENTLSVHNNESTATEIGLHELAEETSHQLDQIKSSVDDGYLAPNGSPHCYSTNVTRDGYLNCSELSSCNKLNKSEQAEELLVGVEDSPVENSSMETVLETVRSIQQDVVEKSQPSASLDPESIDGSSTLERQEIVIEKTAQFVIGTSDDNTQQQNVDVSCDLSEKERFTGNSSDECREEHAKEAGPLMLQESLLLPRKSPTSEAHCHYGTSSSINSTHVYAESSETKPLRQVQKELLHLRKEVAIDVDMNSDHVTENLICESVESLVEVDHSTDTDCIASGQGFKEPCEAGRGNALDSLFYNTEATGENCSSCQGDKEPKSSSIDYELSAFEINTFSEHKNGNTGKSNGTSVSVDVSEKMGDRESVPGDNIDESIQFSERSSEELYYRGACIGFDAFGYGIEEHCSSGKQNAGFSSLCSFGTSQEKDSRSSGKSKSTDDGMSKGEFLNIQESVGISQRNMEEPDESNTQMVESEEDVSVKKGIQELCDIGKENAGSSPLRSSPTQENVSSVEISQQNIEEHDESKTQMVESEEDVSVQGIQELCDIEKENAWSSPLCSSQPQMNVSANAGDKDCKSDVVSDGVVEMPDHVIKDDVIVFTERSMDCVEDVVNTEGNVATQHDVAESFDEDKHMRQSVEAGISGEDTPGNATKSPSCSFQCQSENEVANEGDDVKSSVVRDSVVSKLEHGINDVDLMFTEISTDYVDKEIHIRRSEEVGISVEDTPKNAFGSPSDGSHCQIEIEVANKGEKEFEYGDVSDSIVAKSDHDIGDEDLMVTERSMENIVNAEGDITTSRHDGEESFGKGKHMRQSDDEGISGEDTPSKATGSPSYGAHFQLENEVAKEGVGEHGSDTVDIVYTKWESSFSYGNIAENDGRTLTHNTYRENDLEEVVTAEVAPDERFEHLDVACNVDGSIAISETGGNCSISPQNPEEHDDHEPQIVQKAEDNEGATVDNVFTKWETSFSYGNSAENDGRTLTQNMDRENDLEEVVAMDVAPDERFEHLDAACNVDGSTVISEAGGNYSISPQNPEEHDDHEPQIVQKAEDNEGAAVDYVFTKWETSFSYDGRTLTHDMDRENDLEDVVAMDVALDERFEHLDAACNVDGSTALSEADGNCSISPQNPEEHDDHETQIVQNAQDNDCYVSVDESCEMEKDTEYADALNQVEGAYSPEVESGFSSYRSGFSLKDESGIRGDDNLSRSGDLGENVGDDDMSRSENYDNEFSTWYGDNLLSGSTTRNGDPNFVENETQSDLKFDPSGNSVEEKDLLENAEANQGEMSFSTWDMSFLPGRNAQVGDLIFAENTQDHDATTFAAENRQYDDAVTFTEENKNSETMPSDSIIQPPDSTSENVNTASTAPNTGGRVDFVNWI